MAALFQAKVEQNLRDQIGSARVAANHAYEWSFIKENWLDVVSYCQDASGFLYAKFKERFQQISDYDKTKELTGFESTLLSVFDNQINSWASAQSSSDDVAITTESLKQYCVSQRYYSSSQNNFKLADFIKPEYTVTNPTVFAVAYRAAGRKYLDPETLRQDADSLLKEKLIKVRSNVWETAKGCPKTCPLCCAKCSLETNHLPHQKHECEVHLFQAFRGWRYDNRPAFDICTSKKSIEDDTYGDPQGVPRKMRELYREFHPDWKVQDSETQVELTIQEIQLQRAWVNTRAVFLKRFSMKDNTSPDWIRKFTNKPLT